MPYEHTQGAYPLGRWLSDQRHAGQMSGEHTAELEELGIVRNTADATFAENLAARAYFALHGTLAALRHATAPDKAVGQWLVVALRPSRPGSPGGTAARPLRASGRPDGGVSPD